jgi:small subunit ribosomal protein S20
MEPYNRPMANTKSAKKRTRQNIRRTARNKSVLSTMRGTIKEARNAMTSAKGDALVSIKAAVSKIMKAASKGILHKKTASRYVSRLSRAPKN